MGEIASSRPLIAHVVHCFNTGGLENGVVNLINHLPAENYRHCVISLTPGRAMAERLTTPCEVINLNKRDGQDWRLLALLYQLFRRLKPSVVHSRNLATIEVQGAAWLARVPVRIHGEHGWDLQDPDGTNKKYQWLRRLLSPVIHRFVPLSEHLEQYLANRCHIPAQKRTRICNGVDTERFTPEQIPPTDWPYSDQERVLIAVGRLASIKNQQLVVNSFIELKKHQPELAEKARLVLVGEGNERAQLEALIRDAALEHQCWFAGDRADIPQLLAAADLFVLPSRAEGISNTLLEAMACGKPLIATDVGGNHELLQPQYGTLLPDLEVATMVRVLAQYLSDPLRRKREGEAARARAISHFSLRHMVEQYHALYQEQLSMCHVRHDKPTALPGKILGKAADQGRRV